MKVKKKKKALTMKFRRFFLLFILLIYLAVQRLIEVLSKLLIDPPTKINIFFLSMIHRNRKEKLNEVLTRLDCGQNQRYLFYCLFY